MERKYLIIPSLRVPEVQFGQVLETGPAYLRYNNDNTKTFVKWIGETPDCIQDIMKNGEYWGPYSHKEILSILNTESEWNDKYKPGQ